MTPEIAETILDASLALLEDPGIRFEHDVICDTLLKAGARPGHTSQVLRLPRRMVLELVAQAPSTIHLANRSDGGYSLTPDSPSRAWSVPGLYYWHRGQQRPYTSDDMARCARLLDQLDEVDGVFGLALSDVPSAAQDVVGLRIMAANTRKHIRVLSFTPAGADVLMAMHPVVGQNAWFSMGFTAHGPLRWTHQALDIFARTAGHGIPVTLNGEPTAGVSGPVTVAGSSAVGNAEILAGIVVNQLLEPGRPCIHTLGLSHVLDMRTADAVTGGPENGAFALVGAALGRRLGLPSCGWASTDSLSLDTQAALEKALAFRTQLSGGVSLVWGVGQLESEMTFSPAMAVVDNEILAHCRRLDCGVATDDNALALETIREVGIAGSFLESDHTMLNFREAIWEPQLLYRNRRLNWEAEGSHTLEERAHETAEQLMAAERPPALSDDQLSELQRLEEKYLKALA